MDEQPGRFPWERIVPVNLWVHQVRKAPEASPFFAHDRCSHGRCKRADGYALSWSTVKSGAAWLATWADPDGTNAHPGIGAPYKSPRGERPARGLMLAMGASKPTVIAVLAHLEAVGLIAAQSRANTAGMPRQFATVWCLTMPPAWFDDKAETAAWSAWSRPGRETA